MQKQHQMKTMGVSNDKNVSRTVQIIINKPGNLIIYVNNHNIGLPSTISKIKIATRNDTFYEGCGSGSSRIRNDFLGSGSGIIISDPDPTNIKTNF